MQYIIIYHFCIPPLLLAVVMVTLSPGHTQTHMESYTQFHPP